MWVHSLPNSNGVPGAVGGFINIEKCVRSWPSTVMLLLKSSSLTLALSVDKLEPFG